MVYRDTRTDDPIHETRPAPQARSVERRRWSLGPPGPGMVLGLVGSLTLLGSLLTAWRDPGVRADNVPLRFLVDDDATSRHPSLLLALIPLLVLAVIGTLMPGGGIVRIVAGIGALVVAALFAFQVDGVAVGGDLLDVLDVGVYLAGIGGLILVVSGFAPTWWQRGRTVHRSVDVA